MTTTNTLHRSELLAALPAAGRSSDVPASADAYGWLVGSWELDVLRYWAASRAAYGFVLIPFVTVVLSAWLDDERITASLAIGGLLVLAGVYVGALRPTVSRPQASLR